MNESNPRRQTNTHLARCSIRNVSSSVKSFPLRSVRKNSLMWRLDRRTSASLPYTPMIGAAFTVMKWHKTHPRLSQQDRASHDYEGGASRRNRSGATASDNNDCNVPWRRLPDSKSNKRRHQHSVKTRNVQEDLNIRRLPVRTEPNRNRFVLTNSYRNGSWTAVSIKSNRDRSAQDSGRKRVV